MSGSTAQTAQHGSGRLGTTLDSESSVCLEMTRCELRVACAVRPVRVSRVTRGARRAARPRAEVSREVQ